MKRNNSNTFKTSQKLKITQSSNDWYLDLKNFVYHFVFMNFLLLFSHLRWDLICEQNLEIFNQNPNFCLKLEQEWKKPYFWVLTIIMFWDKFPQYVNSLMLFLGKIG